MKRKKIKAGRVIAIVSGKGGVGKTVTTVNLAASLNLQGKDVIAVDGNLSTPHLALHLGAPIVPVNLHDVLKNKNEPAEAIYEHHSGTKLMPGSIVLKDLYNLKIEHEDFAEVINDLRTKAEIIIIDSAPGLTSEAIMTIKACDDVVVVMTPNLFSVSEALKTIKIAKNFGKNIKGIVVTRARLDDNELKVENIKNLIDEPILGVIQEDDAIRASIMKKDAVVHSHPESQVAHSYMNLAKRILEVVR